MLTGQAPRQHRLPPRRVSYNMFANGTFGWRRPVRRLQRSRSALLPILERVWTLRLTRTGRAVRLVQGDGLAP